MNVPKTPEVPTNKGPMMLVTTPGQNVDGGKKKARTNQNNTHSTGSKATSSGSAGANIPVLKPEPRRTSQPKAKTYGAGGGGGGGGPEGRRGSVATGGSTRSACPSLEETFHLVFLLVAVGFLLVYLREVTIPFVVSVFLMYLFRPLADGVEAVFRDRCCAAVNNVNDEESQREPLLKGYNLENEDVEEEDQNTTDESSSGGGGGGGGGGGVCCSRQCAAYSGRVLGTAISVMFSLLFMGGVAVVVAHVRCLFLFRRYQQQQQTNIYVLTIHLLLFLPFFFLFLFLFLFLFFFFFPSPPHSH